jgi:spermidine/putrescine transport system substrate-binding protein
VVTASRDAGIGRRELLRRGALFGAASLAAPLSACGISASPGDAGRKEASRRLPPLAHEVVIAQWPLYIDKRTVPSFERKSQIDVTYKETINDNQEFFSVIGESLRAGEPTGWDLVALSDWVVAKMNQLGWIESLDYSLLPHVSRNLGKLFRDPPYDPDNAHSVPWQGGITGIGYDPQLTDRPITRFADLWDDAFEGHVGMLTEMVDTMSLTLLMLGVDPQKAAVEDVERAQQALLRQRQKGIVRSYYGQNYVRALSSGDVWATMAWSGDVFWLKQDRPDLEFVVPEEGGIIWTTPLSIPEGARHPRDAHLFLDYVYRPEIAANITEYVGYITPVPEVRDVLVQRRARADSKARRNYLDTLIESPLVFPDDAMSERLYSYKVLSPEEDQRWNQLFQQVSQS